MPPTKTYWWTPAPFLRLLPALMTGIALSWYLPVLQPGWVPAGLSLLLLVLLFQFLPLHWRYRLKSYPGACLLLVLVCLGGWLVTLHDVRTQDNWFGHEQLQGRHWIATLEEMPVAKPNSYKALAAVRYLGGDTLQPVQGRVILYFRKDAAGAQLRYGSRFLVGKTPQPIRNSGNPGAFDYQRYCLFQGITHQVFLAGSDFKVLSGDGGTLFTRTLIRSRLAIVGILKRYISGAQERGLAEALLIGYKDDLDKSLVQAYSNTGVVHVIAISGLHLGLVYGLLVLLLRPLRRRSPLFRFCIIAGGLWAFALLAGAQPSVLRSAVMFSCIALGDLIDRRTSVFNTLALSAFGLLCYNPFWLWDLGFQLSYSAVAGIVIFYQPLYRSIYFTNLLIDWLWQLVALTLTAQVFTLPISLYHFHQFPLLFLLTNLVAVPLSSIILLGEILLCAIAWLPPAAALLGQMLQVLIRWMNTYVLRLNDLPIAVWDGFSLTFLQVILLFIMIAFAGSWLLVRERRWGMASLGCLLLFSVVQSREVMLAQRQRQLVVYNIPKHPAADFVWGRQVQYRGSPALLEEGFERNFHLRPARTLLRAKQVVYSHTSLVQAGSYRVLFYAQPMALRRLPDVLVVSGKARPPMRWPSEPHRVQVVLDATVPRYRKVQWEALCRQQGWQLYDVQERGAFVMPW